MAGKALVTWGGWQGHEPEKVADLFTGILERQGMSVQVCDDLTCFADANALQDLDLIVPVWTMSEIDPELVKNVSEAVARGTGIAGCHGGMCDAFRNNVLWQFMTGGNWVAHPGGDLIDYTVSIVDPAAPLTPGMTDFQVCSEQYYLHVDPAVNVLATTRFPVQTWYHASNPPADVPVAWTKRWGLGRVYYNALGHKADVIDHGTPLEMLERGLQWASQGRAAAVAAGETYEAYVSSGNHY